MITPLRYLHYSLDIDAFARAAGAPLDPWQWDLVLGAGYWIARCGRQVGKSTAAALKALHQAAFEAKSLVLLVSPTERQSRELFAKVTEFSANLGLVPINQNLGSIEYRNRSRIVALPGTPATIRGFSAPKLVIVDEAAFVDREIFPAVRPMLAVSGGNLVLLSTPFVKGDYFDLEWDRDGYNKLEIKSADCPRIPTSFLTKEKEDLPLWLYRREYECVSMESENLVFGASAFEAFRSNVAPLGVQW